ncbi:MAG: hypothetical protein KDE32_09860, partial [Novosphingobium sp.]|nr:hypothetical protein [Novosphingobium sp.]
GRERNAVIAELGLAALWLAAALAALQLLAGAFAASGKPLFFKIPGAWGESGRPFLHFTGSIA